jgi:3-dehydroquinate dehydratase-2
MEEFAMKKVLVMNGPNLNLLGTREPHIYGATTLADVNEKMVTLGRELGLEVATFQSNFEGALVERVHQARQEGVEFVVINPAAYTHTSVALRDAFKGVGMPLVEVHISNVHTREPFRHHSYFSDIAVGTVVGLGTFGYEAALTFAAKYLEQAGK